MRPTFFKRSALVLVLSSFPPILIAQTTAQPKPGDGSKQSSSPDYCQGADQVKDCRDTFEGTFYSGLGIDNFAASELNKYFDPGDASKIKLRAVGGFDFAYRQSRGWGRSAEKKRNRLGECFLLVKSGLGLWWNGAWNEKCTG